MLSNVDYYSILWLDRMRVDCPFIIISSSLMWQFVWTFPASRRSHCARLFPPFQRENLNVNLNFHHLILLGALISWAHGTVDEAKPTKEPVYLLEHVYVKKSWRVTFASLICCNSNIHFGWWCMYIVQQKSWWLGWLNNNHIPVSITHNKVVEKIRFLSLILLGVCSKQDGQWSFIWNCRSCFRWVMRPVHFASHPHRRTCVKKLKKIHSRKKISNFAGRNFEC